MTGHAAFLNEALKTIARALAEAGVDADLHRQPATLSKSLKRRCMAELRRLTILIRRLIFLVALSIELAPLVRREGRNYFSDADAQPGPRRYSLRLAPAPAGVFPGSFRAISGVSVSGPVSAAPVIARWAALCLAVKYQVRRAKSLARTLQRWQAAGVPQPYVLPMARTHRLSPALGLVSGALTVRLNEALRRWPDTG